MIREVVVLAGGFGTRLKSVISDLPKPMALIEGKPFLEYLLTYLNSQGVKRVVLSVGYMKEKIIEYFGSKFLDIDIAYSEEEEPLGTGGAIWKALDMMGDEFILMNGDTYFEVNLPEMCEYFKSKSADVLIAVRKMEKPDRFGLINVDCEGRIIDFKERDFHAGEALINGGVYVVSKKTLSSIPLSGTFSWERDFLAKYHKELRVFVYQSDGYFIDIGIPEDYLRAQRELPERLKNLGI